MFALLIPMHNDTFISNKSWKARTMCWKKIVTSKPATATVATTRRMKKIQRKHCQIESTHTHRKFLLLLLSRNIEISKKCLSFSFAMRRALNCTQTRFLFTSSHLHHCLIYMSVMFLFFQILLYNLISYQCCCELTLFSLSLFLAGLKVANRIQFTEKMMDISFNEINNLCALGNKDCARWEMAIAKGDKNHHWQKPLISSTTDRKFP